MGSHPTLAHPVPAGVDAAQPTRPASSAPPDAQPTTRDLEQASPAQPRLRRPRRPPITHTATKASATASAPWPWGCGWPSTTAARTTATRTSGRPARTTAPPTPSAPPAPSPPARRRGPSGSAPNANHPQHQQGAAMAADNQTTIVGNLVETPNSASPTTASPSPTSASPSPSGFNRTESGATATPPSSRSTSGAAKPRTWPTPCPRATGSWSPAGSASAAGRTRRATSDR